MSRKLEHLKKNRHHYQIRLSQVQRLRLIFGLSVFFLLVLSQIVKGVHLEWVALLFFLPLFIFNFIKSRRLKNFMETLTRLHDFYERQNRFRQGIFPYAVSPEDMENPDLARDLDLGILFASLNLCLSRQGEAQLNRWLCQSFAQSSQTQRRQHLTELLRWPGLLRRIQIQHADSKVDFSAIEKEVNRPFLPASMQWKWLVPGFWFVVIALLFLPVPALLWKVALFCYAACVLMYMKQTQFIFARLQNLHTDFSSLENFTKPLETLGSHVSFAPILKKKTVTQSVKRLSLIISLMSLRTNPILFYILNFILPWDFLLAELAEKARLRFAQDFHKWNQEIIEIDCLACFANLKLYQNTTWPSVEKDHVLEVKDLSHPLLNQETVVTNSFAMAQQGIVIITGSNMSGKSTFLRALGINLCLANIGAPVFALAFRFQERKIMTCIRVSDSLRDGKSYFYAEVQRMKTILQTAEREPVLFLIDEPLRGTNNKERLIGNQSYAEKILASQGCGFLSTHDLELTQLAQHFAEVENYHFSENWEKGDLYFDYKIKHGPSQSTNALKILAREGLYTETHSSSL